MKIETASEPAKTSAETASARKSCRVSLRLVYQVRVLLLAKPRRSMALLISSMRSSVEKISGMTISSEFLKRSKNLALAESSRPRACCER